jgi:hypothetical protein
MDRLVDSMVMEWGWKANDARSSTALGIAAGLPPIHPTAVHTKKVSFTRNYWGHPHNPPANYYNRN